MLYSLIEEKTHVLFSKQEKYIPLLDKHAVNEKVADENWKVADDVRSFHFFSFETVMK